VGEAAAGTPRLSVTDLAAETGVVLHDDVAAVIAEHSNNLTDLRGLVTSAIFLAEVEQQPLTPEMVTSLATRVAA